MTPARRQFLRLGLLATTLPLATRTAAAAPRRQRAVSTGTAAVSGDPLAILGVDDFRALLHSRFSVSAAGGSPIPVRLVRVDDRTPRNAAPWEGEAFTLTFQPPKHASLAQAVYVVEHDTLGAFELLLTRGRQRRGTLVLEAVINRYIPSVR